MQRYSLLAVSLGLACGHPGVSDSNSASASIGSADSSSGDAASDTDDSADAGAQDSSSSTAVSDSAESSSGGGESSSGGPACEQGEHQFVLEPKAPRVMLVLDKSRSMSNLWDHDADSTTPEISRWHSLYNVVETLTSEFDDRIEFGSQLFPSADAWLDEPTNAFSCLVNAEPEVEVAAGTGAAILASMPPAGDFSISGGTPTTAGLQSALAHLETLPTDAPRVILLITDGAANCDPAEAPADTLFVYDEHVPETVAAAWQDHSIPTYVVGINILDELGTKPAVNPYEALTTVADAGGVPSPGTDHFYNAFNELELADALDQVANRIECSVSLPDLPDFPDLVAVSVDGVAQAAVADCTTGDGWAYTNPAGPFDAVQLCGSACEALQGGGTVTVDYNCP